MHNLHGNFCKVLALAKSIFEPLLNEKGNFQHYIRLPKLADIEVVSLSVTAEILSIDSENLLFSKLQDEPKGLWPKLPDRSNYNRRRRRLQNRIAELASTIGKLIPNPSGDYILDSIPLPICQNARIARSKICQDDALCLPTRGYHAAHKAYFYGFKLQLFIHQNGVPQALGLCTASAHDSTYLPYLLEDHIADCQVLADKGYIATNHQLTLFQTAHIRVITPLRKNMKQLPNLWTASKRYLRKRIETLFSQLCDQLLLKRNYAKTTNGLFTRINSKISAITVLQYLNYLGNKPLNHLKHALKS
jgi:hypothetical protein